MVEVFEGVEQADLGGDAAGEPVLGEGEDLERGEGDQEAGAGWGPPAPRSTGGSAAGGSRRDGEGGLVDVEEEWKKKRDWRRGRRKTREGKVAVVLQVGLGGVAKSSLVTWRRPSAAAGLFALEAGPGGARSGMGLG